MSHAACSAIHASDSLAEAQLSMSDLMPAANYTRQNGYPSVVCMRRGPFDYPEPGDDTAARPYRSLMRTRPLFLL